jgi:hypothetical protein
MTPRLKEMAFRTKRPLSPGESRRARARDSELLSDPSARPKAHGEDRACSKTRLRPLKKVRLLQLYWTL